MRGDLDTLMASLARTERDRLSAAFAADPELAEGLSTMLADLPRATQERLLRRIAAHLEQTSRTSSRCRASTRSATGTDVLPFAELLTDLQHER